MFKEIRSFAKVKNPIFSLFLVLFIYTLIGCFYLIDFDLSKIFSSEAHFLKLILTLIISITLFSYGHKTLHLKGVNPFNVAISGLILFLLIHPTQSIWIYITAVPFTYILKIKLRYKGAPIVNPAVLGLLALYYLIELTPLNRLFISWWGANFGSFEFAGIYRISIISLAFGTAWYYFAKKFQRHYYGIAFLVTLILLLPIRYYLEYDFGFFSEETLSILFSSIATWVFMGFVMLAEPKTSPSFKNQQIFLGILGAVILVSLQVWSNLYAVELHTILILNLINWVFFRKKIQLIQRTVTTTTTTIRKAS